MTRDEAVTILDLPREAAIAAILSIADKAEKFDRIHGDISPTCPSGMIPPYLKEPGKKRRKKPGQKVGHKGVCRKPSEAVDHYEDHSLCNCPDCHSPLGKPVKKHKRIIVDIPAVKPEVTEHTINGYWCTNCKKVVYPPVTDALPNATLGNHVLIMTAWLHYWVGMSVRNIVKLLSIFWLFQVSPGGLTQAWHNLAMTLKPIYDGIGHQIKRSAVLNGDETGWRINGITYWLWCFATSQWCYFVIDKSRGSPVVKRVLGKIFGGILICDFWGAYNKIESLAKQRCFFHLFTELVKVDKSNHSPEWKAFRKQLQKLLKDAVRLSIQKPDLDQTAFEHRKMRLLTRLEALIAGDRSNKDVNRIIKRLIRHRDEMFTFLDYSKVSPYNNHAEQQLRKPVITRKISQQNRSNRGAETHAIFMSIFRSAELQGFNPVEKTFEDAKALLQGKKNATVRFDLAA